LEFCWKNPHCYGMFRPQLTMLRQFAHSRRLRIFRQRQPTYLGETSLRARLQRLGEHPEVARCRADCQDERWMPSQYREQGKRQDEEHVSVPRDERAPTQ
jgi:hypothetical protein